MKKFLSRKESAMKSTFNPLTGGAVLILLLTAACAPMMSTATAESKSMAGATSATKAAELRAGLNTLLGEHVMLASAATGAALGGRDAEFKAAATALDGNSVDISRAIGSVYGNDAGQAFLALWRKHIGFVVDYTVGLATNDKAKQNKAVNELVDYTQDFAAFLNSANPNLPKNVVAELVKGHVLTLKDVIDAQAAKDYGRTYNAVRTAAGHMHMIADPLADAIAKQFPDRFASR